MKRHFTKSKDIPTPSDIEILNKHLVSELTINLYVPTKENYFDVVKLLQCRLLCYNKRRSGEIDAIRVESYLTRRKDLSDVDKSLIGELSALERHLLESQDLMIVRGKRGKPVPVIIPKECKKGLDYISSISVRQKVGIDKENSFLFPNSVLGPSRCYESLKKICSQLNQLQHSENINSITMRKYTATLSQVIDLNQNQLDWVCKHLGHTKRIHKEHYQQMSGFIERFQISKLLLVQDLNLTKKYAGKKLDDITFEDVLMTGANANENENEGDVDNSLFENATQVPTVSTSKRPYHDAESSDDDDEMPVRKRKKCKSAKRIRWTSEQIKEIEKHFKTHLEQKTTPGKNECVKVQKSSELLRLKHYTDIVKKISNINHKK